MPITAIDQMTLKPGERDPSCSACSHWDPEEYPLRLRISRSHEGGGDTIRLCTRCRKRLKGVL